MRLTLRTLLAYMDEMLEPPQAEELRKKIDESEFATALVHRIRASTRKLRLDAPKLDGKGLGLDPNTVSEYLDNVLPQDRVPDFEKVCLESEVHLAEVAACHQVLTLVLGEPADVDPDLRLRMYRIVHRPTEAATQRPAVDTHGNGAHKPAKLEPAVSAAIAAASPTKAETAAETHVVAPAVARDHELDKGTRPKPEVPDYLRVSQSQVRIMPIVLTAVFAFVLAVIALRAIGPFDQRHPLLRLFGGETEVAIAPPVVPTPTPTPTPTPPTQPEPKTAEPTSVTPPAETTPSVAEPKPPAAAVEPPATPPTTTPPVPEPAPARPRRPELPAELEPPAEPAPAAKPPAVAPGTTPPPPQPAPAPPEIAAEMRVGRYISEQQVLARAGEGGVFFRLPHDAPLLAGERLFTPPNFQPQILFVSGVSLRLVGPAMLTTTTIPEFGLPGLSLEYGRAVVGTDGRAGARIVVQMGARGAIVTFADADTVIALEVTRFRPPGANPETTVASAVGQVFVLQGKIAWRESETAVETISAGSVFAFVDRHAPQVISFNESTKPMSSSVSVATPAPKWALAKAAAGDIDHQATKDLEPLLASRDVQNPKPLKLMLQELTDHRRVELAALSVRSLSYLDDFSKVNTFFNEMRFKSYWKAYLECLLDALTRGPEPAAALRGQFERERGEAGKHLYDVLVGYSPEQLQQFGARILVEDLEHPSMDHRVFAIDALTRITDKTLLYLPLNDPKRELSKINAWKNLLDAKGIVYKTPPTPLPSRKAAPVPMP